MARRSRNKQRVLMALVAMSVNMASAQQSGKPPATWKEPNTGIEFVEVPKGCFQMGNKKAVVFREEFSGLPLSYHDTPFNDELPQHEVCVDAFWMGRFEVRADEWQRIMGGNGGRADAPAAGMTWLEALRFAEKLTELAGGKYRFRLPTEAEWEYACRAGARTEIVPQAGELRDVAWYGVEPNGLMQETQPVGKLKANAFGLHDMLGNVWEWTLDSYQSTAYRQHPLFNPVNRAPSGKRVIRGTSYRTQPLHVRCAKRSFYEETQSLNTIGLRLVRSR